MRRHLYIGLTSEISGPTRIELEIHRTFPENLIFAEL
jgi:hypothetical protein